MAKFTSTQQQSDQCQHFTSIGNVDLPFSNQPSSFLPQPAFSMSSSACLSSFDLQTKNLIALLKTTLYPQHMNIPTNTVCHSQLIYSFTQTQHEHQFHRSFSIFELYSTTLLSPWISLSVIKFPSHFLSSTMLHFHTELLVLHNSHKQPISALEEISCHTATHFTP